MPSTTCSNLGRRRALQLMGAAAAASVAIPALVRAQAQKTIATIPKHPNRPGIKWTHSIDWNTPSIMGYNGGTYKFPLETGGLGSFQRILAKLAAKGIQDIYLKVADVTLFYCDCPGDICDYRNPDKAAIVAKRNASLIGFLTEVYNSAWPFNVYLYKRQWLQNLSDRKPWPRAMVEDHAPEFVSEMAEIITTARATLGTDGRPVDAVIQGVLPLETQANDNYQTLYAAKYLIEQINIATGNWLKSKTFMMPGAGNGFYFVGIDNNPLSAAFFDAIKRMVDRFAFVVKVMSVTDPNVCSLANIDFSAWTDGNKHLADYERFAAKTMGLESLHRYLRVPDASGKDRYSRYPKLANVLFWGDSGDGLSVIQNFHERAEALRRLLVKRYSKGYGYAFNYSVQRDGDGFQDRSLLLTYPGSPAPVLNDPVAKDYFNWLDTNVIYL